MTSPEEKDLRRRQRILTITDEALIHIFKHFGDFPKSAQCRGTNNDFNTGDWQIKMVDYSYDTVPDACPAPKENITIDFSERQQLKDLKQLVKDFLKQAARGAYKDGYDQPLTKNQTVVDLDKAVRGEMSV